MELNINMSPYFSEKHGVDNEIYWFLRGITKYFEDKSYSDILDIIGLMPIISPQDIERKEMVQCKIKSRLAIISKITDYHDYLNADIEGRKKLMVKNILDSVKSIEKKGRFNYMKFEKDLFNFVKL